MDKVYVVESSWDNGESYDFHEHRDQIEGIFSTYEKAEKFVKDHISEERWDSYEYEQYKELHTFERVYKDEDEYEFSQFSITEMEVQ